MKLTKRDTMPPAEKQSPQTREPAARPRRGHLLEVRFESLAYGGEAIARHEGFVLFTRYGAPGEKALVRVGRVKKNYAEAKIVKIIEPAPERIEPFCPLFTICGGCSWQHLPIEVQRSWKQRIIRDALRSLPGCESIAIRPLVPSPDTWRYRNKMEFTFSRGEDGKLAGGFHKPANWQEILDVEHCWLAPESMERILRAAVAEGDRQRLSAWDPRVHKGTLRQLVLRHCVETQEILALLLTADDNLDFSAFQDALFAAEPALSGIAWGRNAGKSDVARADEIYKTAGKDSFEERLGDFRFNISLGSFFQTNTRGAEKLYDIVREDLELTGRETVLDAYCGTGTIGIYCGRNARQVLGIELSREAVWDARSNAATNGMDNALFLPGDMKKTLPVLLSAVEGRIDRLVVDPPRGGMDKKALAQLLDLQAPVLVYVSCNPSTMARDLEAALKAGYTIDHLTPVDLFPQTYHVECVARLTRRP